MTRRTDRYADPRLRAALAAQYALGVLTPRARRRFTRLMLADPGLREEVRRWKLRLQALTLGGEA